MVQPFLTPEQQMSFAQTNFETSTNLADIDRALTDLRTQVGYQHTQNDTQAKQATSQAKDVYAARGLSQSSVRDSGLYDIQAQNSLRQQQLTDQLNNAELAGQIQKQNIRSYGDDLARSRVGMMASNAATAAGQMAPPPDAPAAGSPQTTSDIPGVTDAQYQQQYGTGSTWASGWDQAFRDAHGGLSIDQYNYLQAMYHQQNG
jgi:hypothetical protein